MERTIENAIAILKRVEQMRSEQKKYFSTRSKQSLLMSKALESKVDKEIKQFFSNQKTLF